MPFFNKFGGGSAHKFGLGKGFNLNPPTNLSAISAETSVSVSFTAPVGDTPTNIAYALSTNGGSTYGGFTNLSPADFVSPITISGLTSNQAYVVKLRSTIGTNQSKDSQALSFQTLATAPTGLSTSGASTSAITISFTQNTGGGATISNYKYALSTNGGSSYGAYTALSPADATSPITIGGLTAGTSYSVKIRAVTAAGDGSESTTASFTTSNPPTSVQYLLVGGGGGGGNNSFNGGGGGGAGGYRAGSNFSITPGIGFTVTVGGAGSQSRFSNLTAGGGGGGGSGAGQTSGGGTGASGGGGGSNSGGWGSGGGGANGDGAGNAGGNGGTGGYSQPGSGGGSSGAGSRFTGASDGGAGGGAGTANSITGTSVTYSSGGSSGGGAAGAANTGRGGGAAQGGGSGIVVIKYPDSFSELTSIGVGLTYTLNTTGGFRIYTFTAGTGTVVS